jgi:two-component sensor histidine kinase/sensor domain CHASE-containing protein
LNKEQPIQRRVSSTLSGLLIGISILIIGIFLIGLQYQVRIKSQEAETRIVLESIAQGFQYSIREVNSIALLLSQVVDENGNVTDFDETASTLMEKYKSVNVLELIRSGVVTHVYPLEGYEDILGYDLYNNERIKLELFKAANNNDIFFSGPVPLIEGKLGVIGLLPFNIDGEDFDVSAVIMYLETLLSQSQIASFSDRYNFEFSRTNLITGKEEFFIGGGDSENIDWEQEQYVIIPEGDWKLFAHLSSSIPLPFYLIVQSLILLFMSSLIGYLSFKLFEKPIELEMLLQERGLELFESRNQFKKNSELLGSILASPQNIIIYSLDLDENYIAFNRNYEELVKKYFDLNVQIGISPLDLYPSNMSKALKENLNRTLKGDSFNIEQEVIDQNNQITFWENWYSPIQDKNGAILGVTVFSVDITKRVNAEKEKTTLLTEIHHRVKNNLAIVSGLLELQKGEVDDQRLKAIFDQSINRIISIALVHELMYNNEDLSSIDVSIYLKKLIPAVTATMQNKAQNVQFELKIDKHELNINEAIPLGLLLNELITNSFKYAFNGSKGNLVDLALRSKENKVYITYYDNGRGYPEWVDFNNPKTLGLNLIHAQLNQLGASYTVDTTNKFTLNFDFNSRSRGSHSNYKVVES